MINRLPITSMIVPRKENLFYLASTAALTRMATGVARVWQNDPKRNQQPISQVEKKKACAERAFVEVFGTALYLAVLHFAQDVTAKILEKTRFKTLPAFENLKGLTEAQTKKLNHAFQEVFGEQGKPGSTRNLIARVIYGEQVQDAAGSQVKRHSDLNALKAALNDDALYQKITQADSAVLKAIRKFKWGAAQTIGAGVLASALVGGPVIQWLNDRVFSPMLDRSFGKNPPPMYPTYSAPRTPMANATQQPHMAGATDFWRPLAR